MFLLLNSIDISFKNYLMVLRDFNTMSFIKSNFFEELFLFNELTRN